MKLLFSFFSILLFNLNFSEPSLRFVFNKSTDAVKGKIISINSNNKNVRYKILKYYEKENMSSYEIFNASTTSQKINKIEVISSDKKKTVISKNMSISNVESLGFNLNFYPRETISNSDFFGSIIENKNKYNFTVEKIVFADGLSRKIQIYFGRYKFEWQKELENFYENKKSKYLKEFISEKLNIRLNKNEFIIFYIPLSQNCSDIKNNKSVDLLFRIRDNSKLLNYSIGTLNFC